MQEELIKRAKELLADGTVARVLGWKAGDLPYNPEPSYFENEDQLKNFVYNGFCGANLSKYMIEASKLEGKTLVFLKPCDTYSFNQLIKEHRVDREKAFIIGVGCKGKLSIEKIREQGIKGIESITGAEMTDDAETLTIQTIYGEKTCTYASAMLGRCHVCKGKEHQVYDYQNVSAVMPAVTYVRHAAAVNVYLTAQNSTVHRRQMWMISKRRCSTLSVHST